MPELSCTKCNDHLTLMQRSYPHKVDHFLTEFRLRENTVIDGSCGRCTTKQTNTTAHDPHYHQHP